MNQNELETAAWRITGVVQGVGFRYWTRGRALGLGIRGTVRNAPDGTVEVQAAGTPDQLSEFRRLLQRGPAGSIVRAVESIESSMGDFPVSFKITR